MTPQEIHELAQQVCIDRLNRGQVIGHTKSGRCIVDLIGEPTAAEVLWVSIKAPTILAPGDSRG